MNEERYFTYVFSIRCKKNLLGKAILWAVSRMFVRQDWFLRHTGVGITALSEGHTIDRDQKVLQLVTEGDLDAWEEIQDLYAEDWDPRGDRQGANSTT